MSRATTHPLARVRVTSESMNLLLDCTVAELINRLALCGGLKFKFPINIETTLPVCKWSQYDIIDKEEEENG